jgi:PAS domain S-box-containing protein
MQRSTGKPEPSAVMRYVAAIAFAASASAGLWWLAPLHPAGASAVIFTAVALAALGGRGPGLLTLAATGGVLVALRSHFAAFSLSPEDALLLSLHIVPAWLAIEAVCWGRSRASLDTDTLAPDAELLKQLGAIPWEAAWRQSLELDEESFKVLRISPEIETLTGYSPERWVADGDFHLSLVHPEDRQTLLDFCSRLADGDAEGAVEYRLTRSDGAFCWVRHLMTASTAAEPGRVILRGMLVSIADRKETELALRASEQWYRRLVDTATEGILVLNPDGSIAYANRRFGQMLGLRPERISAQPLSALLAEESRDYAAVFFKNLKPDHTDQHDFRLLRADGAECWALVSACSVRNERGKVVGALVMFTDVTERRQAEEALQDAARAKDEFLAMLAHELRNPLGALRNSLEVLRRAGSGEARERALGVAERQVAHQVRMVDDLLDVSRLTRDKVELHRRPLDLAALIAEVAEDYRPAFNDREVALKTSIPREAVPVEADPTRLAQVVGNLLANSLKFTEAGGWVDVRLAVRKGFAEITVRDDGHGIAPELLPRVFETFAQGDQSLARTPGGLGLGLALVKGLVELHGGSVTARSGGLGRGAEFIVRLPLTKAVTPEAAMPLPTIPEALTVRPRSVLVVEDIPDAAETLRDLLELAGHEVHVASNGALGLDAVWEHHPEVVLCDIGLPEIDGYELARRVRARQNGYRPFLVAVTGYGQDTDRERARAAGFDAHLVKPVRPEELLQLLGREEDSDAALLEPYCSLPSLDVSL